MAMTTESIIKSVRLCFDEEVENASGIGDATGDSTSMDNIIKAKIGDGLRWICLYAPPERLAGGSVGTGDVVKDVEIDFSDEEVEEGGIKVVDVGNTEGVQMTMPKDYLKLLRVRVNDWHKAVTVPAEEDSEESLMVHDDTASATADRPVVIVRRGAKTRFELWPCESGKLIEVSYVVQPTVGAINESTTINIPSMLETSFVYYIAFLVLSAYADPRAARMLEIAQMNLRQAP
ncbi:MAG: hypothetical protein IJT48_12085 [Bacteroidaceae bacterium]|nr:hypothetical protein [Bacteroidaceae bacterium]